jgi:hypothetical protein
VSQGRPIKNVVTDGGGEFKSSLADKGVVVHISAPYTPQQNPVAKRGHCKTTKKARTLLKKAKISNLFWGYAVEMAVFLENVTPTRKNRWLSLYELWFG